MSMQTLGRPSIIGHVRLERKFYLLAPQAFDIVSHLPLYGYDLLDQ